MSLSFIAMSVHLISCLKPIYRIWTLEHIVSLDKSLVICCACLIAIHLRYNYIYNIHVSETPFFVSAVELFNGIVWSMSYSCVQVWLSWQCNTELKVYMFLFILVHATNDIVNVCNQMPFVIIVNEKSLHYMFAYMYNGSACRNGVVVIAAYCHVITDYRINCQLCIVVPILYIFTFEIISSIWQKCIWWLYLSMYV